MVEFEPFGGEIRGCEDTAGVCNDVPVVFTLNFPHPNGFYKF